MLAFFDVIYDLIEMGCSEAMVSVWIDVNLAPKSLSTAHGFGVVDDFVLFREEKDEVFFEC